MRTAGGTQIPATATAAWDLNSLAGNDFLGIADK
jgi:hypothetical protein